MNIHPSSIISKECELDEDVIVGPFCIIKGKVKIGKGTVLESHVVLGSENGIVEIGQNNRFSPGSVIGCTPQDKKYKGEATSLKIGDNNQIREFITISLGTVNGGGMTIIGSHNLIMAYTHFGHDCRLGDNNVVANCCQMAGHVHIENKVTVGGMCAINQFVRIGNFAFVAGGSAVNKDILPYTISHGNHAIIRATNKIGLERGGFAPEVIEQIHKAIRIVTKGGEGVQESLARVERECASSKELKYFIDFARSSERGIAL